MIGAINFDTMPDEWEMEQMTFSMGDFRRAIDAISAAIEAKGAAEERARCASIAKTGWVSADYNIVGIADADVAMKLCEHIADAIEAEEDRKA